MALADGRRTVARAQRDVHEIVTTPLGPLTERVNRGRSAAARLAGTACGVGRIFGTVTGMDTFARLVPVQVTL